MAGEAWDSDQGSGSSTSSESGPPMPLSSSTRLESQSSLPTTIDDPPTPNQEKRREIDGAFVRFLIDYAANDPECPPLFKAYLEEVVLKPGVEDLRLKVEYHLRNPDIKNYGLGTTFVRELEQYTVYDQVFPRRKQDEVLPSAPIPAQYQPRTHGRTAPGLEIESVLVEEANEEDAGQEDEDENDGERMRGLMLSRLRALEGQNSADGTRSGPPLGATSRSVGDAWASRGTGKMAELYRRLQSIPPLPAAEDFAGTDEIRDRTGPDWTLGSWYRGRCEPPLAARLETVVKFLAEEDVDRCMNWEAKFMEIVSYLEWLAHEDDRQQLQHAGPQTRAMFNEAVTKAKVHVLFEKHHYDSTPLEIAKPATAPLRSTRLDWVTDAHDCWPLPSRYPLPDGRRRPVLPPIDAATLRRVCQSADGPQWTPPRLDRAQLPAQLETMPCTVAYRARLGQLRKARELARLRVEERYGVTLPRNLVVGGPLVLGRTVDDDPDVQASRDLLRQCYTAVGVLRAAHRRVPRPLLKAVLDMVDRAESGEFRRNLMPTEVRLASDEWEQLDDRQAVPKYLDSEELAWLRFLAGECVNGKNWTGRFVPDTPKDKYCRFLLFATRVQKLLDDKSPDGLFSRHNAEVTVEQLLEAVNAGAGSSAVTRDEFQPHDACCWLDRMRESGHVRFRLDLACYGVVQRPVVEYFPEHRLLWPTARETRARPNYYLGYISDWHHVVRDGNKPDISEGSTVWNFFVSLGFRLGYTISMLEQEKKAEQGGARVPTTTTPAHDLREPIAEWEKACDDLLQDANSGGGGRPPTAQELTTIRARIIDEVSANETMLAPGRGRRSFDRHGQPHTALVRDHNWDWAAAARRRGRPRQFWSVDRWPVDRGVLPPAAERAVKNDEDLDPAMTYDPAALNPTTDRRYTQPKLRPYGPHDKVVFRPGPAIYPVGDTRRQREAVERHMTDMVYRAVGLDRHHKRTWSATLAKLNPFATTEGRSEDGKLPPVSLAAVPRSWDPDAERERVEAAERHADDMGMDGSSDREDGDEGGQDGGDEDDEIESLDVLMTGMGEQ